MQIMQRLLLVAYSGKLMQINALRYSKVSTPRLCHMTRIRGLSSGHIGICHGFHGMSPLYAKPKRGSVVDSYRTVKIFCQCNEHLFDYKKMNGTKGKLVKMYIERIVSDPHSILLSKYGNLEEKDCICPRCSANWGRPTTIKGLPAIKIVGNRVRMK